VCTHPPTHTLACAQIRDKHIDFWEALLHVCEDEIEQARVRARAKTRPVVQGHVQRTAAALAHGATSQHMRLQRARWSAQRATRSVALRGHLQHATHGNAHMRTRTRARTHRCGTRSCGAGARLRAARWECTCPSRRRHWHTQPRARLVHALARSHARTHAFTHAPAHPRAHAHTQLRACAWGLQVYSILQGKTYGQLERLHEQVHPRALTPYTGLL
jgi:hypothetical protein